MNRRIAQTTILLATICTAAICPAAEKTARVCAVTQSWAAKDRNLEHVLGMIDRAAAQRADIVCLPEQCVPTDGGEQARKTLEAIAQAAAARKIYIAANLNENSDGKLYSTSYLIGPDGKVIGKYRKSHRLPDEQIALGDELPVFDTRFGKVGLMIGTDHYWPEIPLVMALDGAELILWSYGPEPVPQGYPLDIKMRVRAWDNHVTLVCAGYSGALPYLCSNYPGYTGEPLGRSYVINRSGTIVADTGFRVGAAVAQVDLGRPRDIYGLTFKSDRKLFRYLVDPKLKPVIFKGTKRKIKLSIAQVASGQGPNPNPDSQFAKIIDEAGGRGSDVILMTEFHFPTDTEIAEKTFALVAEKARKYNSYIIDPYGHILAASQYWRDCVVTAEVDLDAPQIWFARSDRPGRTGRKGYLAGYYPKVIPEKRTDFRSVLLAGRRPELYKSIVEESLAGRAIPAEVWKEMAQPRKD